MSKRFNSRKVKMALAGLPQKVGALVFKFFMKNFERQGFEDQNFKKWERLKNPTGRKILQDTGRLKAGFQYWVRGNLIRVFNLVPYAAYHQPKRKMLGESEVLKEQITHLVKKEIIKSVRR